MWYKRKSPANTPEADPTDPPWVDKMAGSVARAGIKLQKAFAAHMNRWMGKLSPQKLRTALVAFSLFGAGTSGYLILSSVGERGDASSPLPIESLRIPKNVGGDGKDRLPPTGAPDVRILQRIHAFRQYMDSLRNAGHPLQDHLHSNRQGLLDSLHRVEKMYPSKLLK